jgi:hypothetical protein
MSKKLDGKIAVITGGSAGIGLASPWGPYHQTLSWAGPRTYH